MADKSRFESVTTVDETKFDGVNFSDFFDISGKSTEITSMDGRIKKMRGSSLYLVTLEITIASGSGAAGSSGFYIGRFKKEINPRVAAPLISHSSDEVRGVFYSNSPSTLCRIYGNTGTGLHYVNFTCYATDPA